MNSPRTTLYRDKTNAKLMGVCSGIADYTGVDTFWVRLGFLDEMLEHLITLTGPFGCFADSLQFPS